MENKVHARTKLNLLSNPSIFWLNGYEISTLLFRSAWIAASIELPRLPLFVPRQQERDVSGLLSWLIMRAVGCGTAAKLCSDAGVESATATLCRVIFFDPSC